jgi:biotin carboxyl carrier protein
VEVLTVKFKIQIDGAEYEVEAGAGGNVDLAGETFETKVGRPSTDRRTVQVGDKGYEVRVVENGTDSGVFILEIAGERVPVTVSEVARSAPVAVAAAAGGDAGGDTPGAGGQGPAGTTVDVKHGVWAPVPGKIVNVMVKVGDKVEEGAPVVILEAMKMENELHSPVKGTVSAVPAKKGDQAEKGQLLVAFE